MDCDLADPYFAFQWDVFMILRSDVTFVQHSLKIIHRLTFNHKEVLYIESFVTGPANSQVWSLVLIQ